MRSAIVTLLGLAIAWMSLESTSAGQGLKQETMAQKLAKKTKLKEEQVQKLLEELGPAIQEELSKGKTVSFPAMGTFRVVRIAEHKDMTGAGVPFTTPAYNSVEFKPDSQLSSAANAPGAVPQEIIPPFVFRPLQNQVPGQKTGRTRTPQTRVK